jgi:hypothetical protein
MAWIIDTITEDIGDPENFEEIQSYNWVEEKHRPKAVHRFRILDDDGIIYYYGFSTTSNTERAFDPLDDYAMPNDGATEIQYFENGEWETL